MRSSTFPSEPFLKRADDLKNEYPVRRQCTGCCSSLRSILSSGTLKLVRSNVTIATPVPPEAFSTAATNVRALRTVISQGSGSGCSRCSLQVSRSGESLPSPADVKQPHQCAKPSCSAFATQATEISNKPEAWWTGSPSTRPAKHERRVARIIPVATSGPIGANLRKIRRATWCSLGVSLWRDCSCERTAAADLDRANGHERGTLSKSNVIA